MTTTVWRPDRFVKLIERHATEDKMAVLSPDAMGTWEHKEKGGYIRVSFGISADAFEDGKLDNLLAKGTVCFVVVLTDRSRISRKFREQTEAEGLTQMTKQQEPELCSSCRKPFMEHTKDQAVDCGKIGYWTYLVKRAAKERPEVHA